MYIEDGQLHFMGEDEHAERIQSTCMPCSFQLRFAFHPWDYSLGTKNHTTSHVPSAWVSLIGQGCTSYAMDRAAENGHLRVLRWLHENRTEGCTIRAMNWASLHGHLEVVKWLHENRREGCTEVAMDNAAKNGHLEVVKFLHFNRKEGCRWE